MLVLIRRPITDQDSVDLDGPGKVVVLGVKGNRVRLGFIAPDSTRVVRSELTCMGTNVNYGSQENKSE